MQSILQTCHYDVDFKTEFESSTDFIIVKVHKIFCLKLKAFV